MFTRDFIDTEREDHFSSRITYVNQFLIARKFNKNLSLQLTPTVIHKNLVPTVLDLNDLFAIGIGGRYKFTKRIALTAEYHYSLRFPRNETEYNDPLSIGVDIETGVVSTHKELKKTSDLDVGESCDYTTKVLDWAQSIGCEIKIPVKCDYRNYLEKQNE
ncbi:MAG: DUF5777 family beta-barrel protein [Methylococcales bacterium]